MEGKARGIARTVDAGAHLEGLGQMGLGQRLIGRAIGQNAPLMQDQHPVGKFGRKGEIVQRGDDGQAKALQQRQQFKLVADMEKKWDKMRRIVEEEAK